MSAIRSKPQRLPVGIAAAMVVMAAGASAAPQPTPELQALDDALPGDLINDPTTLDWNIYGPGMKRKTVRNANIPGGGVALQVTSPTAELEPHRITAEAPINEAIAKQDRITVAFYARALKADTVGNQGVVTVRLQQKTSPWPGFGNRQLTIGSDWKLYDVTAVADISIPKGEAIVAFQLGGAKQVIEIGQTYVLNNTARHAAER